MPQYIEFFDDEMQLRPSMTTSNRSDTCYDIKWLENGVVKQAFDNFDTGIQRQPQGQQARVEDFKNDCSHSRRSLGALIATLPSIVQESSISAVKFNNFFQLRLRTNKFVRGWVVFKRIEETLDVSIRIGTGPNRVDGAIPADPLRLDHGMKGVDFSGSVLDVANLVFLEIGQTVLSYLADSK